MMASFENRRHTHWVQRLIGFALLLFMVAGVGSLTGWLTPRSQAGIIASGIPDLPGELLEKPKKRRGNLLAPRYTLVDFYANWCSTCKKLAPEVDKLSEQLAHKVHTLHINIDLPQNEKYATLFNVHGTPTYMLFTPEGKAVYKMEKVLLVSALRARTMALLGLSPAYKLPDDVPATPSGQYTLVAFRPKACVSCAKIDPLITPLDENPKAKLAVVHLDPDIPAYAAYQKQVKLDDREGYILLDTNFHPLMRFLSTGDPRDMRQTLVFFLNGTW
jgi:thiol-disulfide isomerase/thioredoxin